MPNVVINVTTTALAFCVFISLGIAAPISDDAQAKTLIYDNENDGQGNYAFRFQTSNGIERMETGRLVNVGQPDEHLEVRGSYSYTDPEGKFVIVNYFADENGYHVAEGKPMAFLEPGLLLPITPVSASLPSAAVASLLGR